MAAPTPTTTTIVSKKKRGPVARPGRVRVTVYLDEETAQWGKHQEGGLSDLVRRLLAEAKDGADAGVSGGTAGDAYPPELRATYQRLTQRKLRAGLSPGEERELAKTRERINAVDRESLLGRERERAATAIDQELSDLRREIEAMPEKAG